MTRLFVPIELTCGNKGQGNSWHASHTQRQVIEDTLRLLDMTSKPFPYRVDMIVTRILGKRQSLWDSPNILRGNSKQLIDALVACGWLTDDGPKYLRHCDGRQDDTRRGEGPAVEVTFTEVM